MPITLFSSDLHASSGPECAPARLLHNPPPLSIGHLPVVLLQPVGFSELHSQKSHLSDEGKFTNVAGSFQTQMQLMIKYHQGVEVTQPFPRH